MFTRKAALPPRSACVDDAFPVPADTRALPLAETPSSTSIAHAHTICWSLCEPYVPPNAVAFVMICAMLSNLCSNVFPFTDVMLSSGALDTVCGVMCVGFVGNSYSLGW